METRNIFLFINDSKWKQPIYFCLLMIPGGNNQFPAGFPHFPLEFDFRRSTIFTFHWNLTFVGLQSSLSTGSTYSPSDFNKQRMGGHNKLCCSCCWRPSAQRPCLHRKCQHNRQHNTVASPNSTSTISLICRWCHLLA